MANKQAHSRKKILTVALICLTLAAIAIIISALLNKPQSSSKQPRDCRTFAGKTLCTDMLVGLTEAEAKKIASDNNADLRIIERDNKPVPQTGDGQTNRVYLYVNDGKITRASFIK